MLVFMYYLINTDHVYAKRMIYSSQSVLGLHVSNQQMNNLKISTWQVATGSLISCTEFHITLPDYIPRLVVHSLHPQISALAHD